MNEDEEGTPIGDTPTQFKWIPQKPVGSAEVGTSNSNVEDAGVELERLKEMLEALEERQTRDGREQNRRDISRVMVKDENVPILKSTEVEEYRRWKKKLLWRSECTQILLDTQAPHVIMNGITNAESIKSLVRWIETEHKSNLG